MKFMAWLANSLRHSSWKDGSWEKEDETQILASLGGFAPSVVKKPVSHVEHEEVEIVEEAIPEAYISRIRNEFLSEAMAKDLINRAKQRKSRAEEEALLLIL